jgi:hypothetical protein
MAKPLQGRHQARIIPFDRLARHIAAEGMWDLESLKPNLNIAVRFVAVAVMRTSKYFV